MRILIWIDLQTLDLGLLARHYHNHNVDDFASLEDCMLIISVNLNKYQSLFFAPHISTAAGVRA